MQICHFCSQEVKIERKVFRNDSCPNCQQALHCCLNCEFYSEYSHNKCLEPQSEWVGDREKANFCEFFKFSTKTETVAPPKSKEEAMKILDVLFKSHDN